MQFKIFKQLIFDFYGQLLIIYNRKEEDKKIFFFSKIVMF